MNVQLAVSLSRGCYAWRAEDKDFLVFGDSKIEAIDKFKQCYLEEAGKVFSGRITNNDTTKGLMQ